MVWISRIHAYSCRTSLFHRLTCDNRSLLGLVCFARKRRQGRPIARVAPRTPFGGAAPDIDTTPGTPGRRSRERGATSTGRAGGWRSRRRGRARRSRSCRTARWGRTVGREHRPTSRSAYVHSVATRGSPHIAVPSPSHISLPCAAHQSECGRTPPARGRHHKEDPSP